MITFAQGCEIAQDTGMRYEPGWDYHLGEEDPTLHVFDEQQMDSTCCWIRHLFFVADSVQDVLERWGSHGAQHAARQEAE